MTHDTPASFMVQGFGTPTQHQLVADKESCIRALSLQITTQMLQRSVEAEVSAELGQPYEVRGDGECSWQCRRCGTRNRRAFRRNGHYRRSLTVREGTVLLCMPLVRCRCKGYVKIPWQTVDLRARYWLDVELEGIRRYMGGMSYRLVGDAAGTQAQTNISHVQSWRTMQEVGQGTADAPVLLSPCPRSVIVDEVYVSVEGMKKVFLVAVAEDGRVLAVRGPTERTLGAWQGLLEWLTEHGIGPLQGLVGVTYDGDSAIRGAVRLVWPHVVLQQCVWHVMERVADDVGAAYGPHAPEVKRIVEQAGRVLLGDAERPDALERARRRLAQYLVEHGKAAWAQTLERAFEEATEYLKTSGLHRTNGLAERTIKELRRRTKTMDGFKSDDGSAHFVVIWRVWKNLRSKMNKERAQRVQHRCNLKIRHGHPKPA